MPYTQQHKQYLQAMGLVPWVLRGQKESAAAVADTAVNAVDVNTTQDAGDCSVLWVFNHITTQNRSQQVQPILSAADNRLLLDMLGAIGLQDKAVARRSLTVDISVDMSSIIQPLVTESVKAILVAVEKGESSIGDDEASSRLLASELSVPVWQIPHPSWIQQEPGLKRRAWNVLKALRLQLQASETA